MKYTTRRLSAIIMASTLCAMPLLVFAQGALGDVCNGPDCQFEHLILLANKIIKFLIFTIAVPLAAIGIMFAGGRLALMPNKEEELNKAKESFKTIGIGFLVMMGAFLLIKFILFQFLNQEGGFTLFLLQ